MALDERVRGKTAVLGLVGNPVEHSVSPQLHNTLSARLGTDTVYIPMRVDPDRLGDAVKGFKAAGFKGFNVTIPFKEEIIKYVDVLSEEVKITGSANTVRIAEGRTCAYSTDAEGFVRSFEKETGLQFKGKKVLILGAGGTARALALKIASRDAEGLAIVNRTAEKASDIAGMVRDHTRAGAEAFGTDKLDDGDFINGFDIIVNTTSLGMYPKTTESPLGGKVKLDPRQAVYDVIYNPARTTLLKQAEAFGCKTVNGMGMLFWQGILAYELWMEIKIPGEITDGLWRDFSEYNVRPSPK